MDVCVRQPGQVRKEAATTDCGGSFGSFITRHMEISCSLGAPWLRGLRLTTRLWTDPETRDNLPDNPGLNA